MNHTPRTLAPFDTPPVRTADDLHLHWRRLMGPLGFAQRSLWVALFDRDDLVLPTLPRLDRLPATPSSKVLRTFIEVLAKGLECATSGCSAAFLLSRHGPQAVNRSDHAYLQVLRTESALAGLSIRPMFVATSSAVHLLELPEAA